MLAALGLALGDLADRRMIGVLARSLAITLVLFAGFTGLLIWALNGSDPCGLLDESCPVGIAGGAIGGILLGLVALWLLFPAVSIGVTTAFLDRIMRIVEERHYADRLAGMRPLGVAGNAGLGLRSGARILVYNLAALPFYLLLLVTGIGPILLFLAVNGLALGRDYGEMTSYRHLERPRRAEWLGASRSSRTLLGIAVTALFLVPIVNLLAPVIGAAAATHLFHRRRSA